LRQPENVFYGTRDTYEVLTRPLELVKMAAAELVRQKVPEKLLRQALEGLQVSPDLWKDEDQFRATINKLQDQAFGQALEKLRKAAVMDDKDQVDELILCEGAGVMCAVAAALPDRYLTGQITLPAERLEIDMRGEMIVGHSASGEFARINIGAFQYKPDCLDAVQQLGIRLATIAWFVRSCCNVQPESVHLTGRLFVPKGTLDDTDVQAAEELAWSDWKCSLYIHRV
jgi:hypothetical protein